MKCSLTDLVTIGGFLLSVELLRLQVCLGASLLTVGAVLRFLLELFFYLQLELFCLQLELLCLQ